MSERGAEPVGLTAEELDAEHGEESPDGETRPLTNADVTTPVNAAAALNVLSDDSTAVADAEQSGDIDQRE